jgi:hypothetical protein
VTNSYHSELPRKYQPNVRLADLSFSPSEPAPRGTFLASVALSMSGAAFLPPFLAPAVVILLRSLFLAPLETERSFHNLNGPLATSAGFETKTTPGPVWAGGWGVTTQVFL